MASSARIHRLWPSWLVLFALVALFLGERTLAAYDAYRIGGATLAAALLVFAIAIRATEWTSSPSQPSPFERRSVRGWLLLYTLGVATALLIYALVTVFLSGDDPTTERIRGVLWVLWPLLLAISALPLLSLELAVHSVAHVDRYEHAQIRHATTRGLSVALFIAILMLANYVAVRNDQKLDFGSDTGVKASPQTQRAVRNLTSDVTVRMFFPRANEVADRLRVYFEPLQVLNPRLRVEQLDHALAFEQASAAAVSENGYVAVYRDTKTAKIRVGTTEQAAQKKLLDFDVNFVKALIRVTRPKRNAYFYTGHDERAIGRAPPGDIRPGTRKLEDFLRTQQYNIKPWSPALGSTLEIPADADLLLIIGPERPFSEAEVSVLLAAIKRGTRLFVALEAERTGDPLAGLLAPMGLAFDKTPLVAPRSSLRVRGNAADTSYMVSNLFSTHASVTTMTREADRSGALFFRAGSLARAEASRQAAFKTDIVLTARQDAFADANGNRRRDPQEVATGFGLAAAVTATSTTATGAEGRVFVLADADAMSDELFDLAKFNLKFFTDVLNWLEPGAESFVPVSKQADVRIARRTLDDALAFLATTFVAPILLLVLGALATRNRGRKK